MKILIAEDDLVSNKLLVTNLAKWGHEVTSVTDGAAAIQSNDSDGPFDMAILDWMMPGKEGPEVCSAIKQNTSRGFTYVILLTAKTQTDDIVSALDAGADEYVTKPWNASELHARIRSAERIVNLERKLVVKVNELTQALEHVKQLQGIVPICAWCKRVRDDSQYWSSVESYISKHSEAKFSHSICPECTAKHYPD